MNEMRDIESDNLKTLIFIAVMVFVVFGVGGFIATAGQGFKDATFTDRYSKYFILGGAGLFLFGLAGLVNFLSGKRLYYLPIHEPEDSLLYGWLKRSWWFVNPAWFAWFSLLFSLIFSFYLGKVANTFFSSIPQSIGALGGIWSASIFPLVENVFFWILIPGTLLQFSRALFYKRSMFFYWVTNLVVIPLFSGRLWAMFHNVVYGANEAAQYQTFIFGVLWVFLTMLFLSQIISIALHFTVNFVLAVKLAGLFSNDAFFIMIVIIMIILFIITYTLYFKTKKKATS